MLSAVLNKSLVLFCLNFFQFSFITHLPHVPFNQSPIHLLPPYPTSTSQENHCSTVNNVWLIVTTTKCLTYIQLYFSISLPGRIHNLTWLYYKYICYFARQDKRIFSGNMNLLFIDAPHKNIKLKGKYILLQNPQWLFSTVSYILQ